VEHTPAGNADDRQAAGGREQFHLLAVDDQPEILTALRRLLGRRGFALSTFTDPLEALAALDREAHLYDLVLLDITMPGMSGFELLRRARDIAPDLPVIMLTADQSAATAVAALKAGAFNHLTKPLDDPDAVALTLQRAGSYGALRRRTRELEARVGDRQRLDQLVGATPPMREVFATIDKLARSDVTVLLRGESGTGKELAARAIHDRSARHLGPFVALNCAAIPDPLIDSELFGHTRGAFTGAASARPGVFVEADQGTLFLDEIGDLPPPVQSRLLRVLQEGEVRAVGGTGARAVDVRVIAATHVDLDAAVAQKQFRADLYYRLNVVSLTLPPLRERRDDVPLLAAHFLHKHARVSGDELPPRFTPRAAHALSAYDWPGNVRELENAVQHALVLAHGALIDVDALPQRIAAAGPTCTPELLHTTASDPEAIDWADELPFTQARRQAQERFERTYLTRLLSHSGGNISEAARRAGLDRSNFRRILARHGLLAGHRD
jgi:two-component system response regulator HydG